MGALGGLLLHAIGGFAAGSFYLPIKQVKDWAWESSWLILGLAAWLFAPIIAAYLTTPEPFSVIAAAPAATLGWTYFFGLLWGIGGLTFGLSMRYLGLSLGMAVALGFTAAFGTLIPPIYEGTFGRLFATRAGLATFAGVMVCLVGIAVCGLAGSRKDKELAGDQVQEAIAEFDLSKGLVVAVVSGILSACFAFGLAAGGDIATASLAAGTDSLYQNNATLIVILLGGLTTNLAYCLYLNVTRKSSSDYTDKTAPLTSNYAWAALGGVTWYLQFFFYGMGATLLGEQFEFASWTLHMAFIILSSNALGFYSGEWKGASPRTLRTILLGLGIILFSTVMIGLGNYL